MTTTHTHTTASPFADALRADMAALGINPRILGQRLGITQQAVDKWIRRGFPPPNRIQDLVAALGRECAVEGHEGDALEDDDALWRTAPPEI